LNSSEISLPNMVRRLRFSPEAIDCCLRFNTILALYFLLLIILVTPLCADDSVDAASSKRIDILRYGIESQVMELLTTLGEEKNDDYSEYILKVFDASASPKLKSAIFEYFGRLHLDSVGERAVEIIKNRSEIDDSLVGNAFSYLLQIKSKGALTHSIVIVKEDEKRYLKAAIKMIGSVGSDSEVSVLVSLFEAEGTDDAVKEIIVLALGEMKSKSSYELLATIASSNETSMMLRMYACSALGELGEIKAIPVLVTASVASIPNVRANAVEALGNFSNDQAKLAVREGLRDQHVLVRIAAAKACANNLDVEAIPYLEFKVLEDPEKAVREGSINALAVIGGRRAETFLADFAIDAKKPVLYRGFAFGALIKHGRKSEFTRLEAMFKTVQADKDRSTFNIMAKTLVTVDGADAEPFIAILLDDSDYQMRLGAIVWIDRNKNDGFKAKLLKISESDSIDSVKRRALQALERIGS
jgi:HEAT repeat protein